MALLTKIEDIISIPMELFHKQKGFHPVDLNRMALRCMERGCRKGIKQVYAPNWFEVVLNPTDYEDLQPFLGIIRSDITGELRRVIEERNYLLAGDLEVELTEDPEITEGLPAVNGYMQGDEEHESTFSYTELEDEPDTDERPFYLDADTILVVPEFDSETTPEAQEALEEGIAHLKEGLAEEAHESLSDVKDELDGLPQYHAALAVALEILNRPVEALEHYRRLEAIEGGRPDVWQRIGWLGQEVKRDHAQPLPLTVLGRLEIMGMDALLHFGTDGVYIENPGAHPDVQVNNRVVSAVMLTEGAEVRLGEIRMTFRSSPEVLPEQQSEMECNLN